MTLLRLAGMQIAIVLAVTLVVFGVSCAGQDRSLSSDDLSIGWHDTDVKAIKYADPDTRTRCYRYVNGFQCVAK